MTAYTDRADALEAAIRDMARDIEADLAKADRYRGTENASSAGYFTDPGKDLAAYAAQKHAADATTILGSYRNALAGARDALGGDLGGRWAQPVGSTELNRRLELIALIEAIKTIRTRADAVALIATFEEN